MSLDLVVRIDKVIREGSMLRHPFYQMWNEGTLTRGVLREYALQYNHFVREFPRMVSAVHSNIPELATRSTLLLNLMDEEMGDDNHPALWSRFAHAMGASKEDMEHSIPLPSTLFLVDTMMGYCRNHSYQEGVAALYAYESQIPEVSRVKIEGLMKFYGIADPGALKFFSVHQEADLHHSRSERGLIEMHTTEESAAVVYDAARRTTEALWRFLDGVLEAYVPQRPILC